MNKRQVDNRQKELDHRTVTVGYIPTNCSLKRCMKHHLMTVN